MQRVAGFWIVGIVAAAVGCGGDPAPSDGGAGIDATALDAGPGLDAGDVDGGELDAGELDGGSDAGAPEPCDSPGATETVPCGRCGTVDRFCTATGTWAYGLCAGEGECAAGTVGERACGRCGSEPLVCTAACTWASSGACAGEGACEPGTRTRSAEGCTAGSTRELLCSDACALEPAGACEPDGCPTPGALETIACGACGSQTRFCTAAHAWDYGACEGERGCTPGTTRSASCGMCGTTTERCDVTCTWIAGACTGEGTCVPGTTVRTSEGCTGTDTRLVRCTAACALTEVVEPCGSPVDAGVDAGRDAGLDGGRDAGLDAGRDAGLDAALDAGRDGGRDAGSGDAGPPPVTIGAIQRGEIAAGTAVVLRGLVVTAVRSDTLWVQDPLGGTTYAGIKVYVGGPHGAVRDDRVDVEGVVHEYFDDTELVSAIVTVTGVATPITPVALTVAQAATEPYEGMLVRLTDVSSVQWPYDCALDNPACVDARLWQVNGAIGVLVHDPVYESLDWDSRVRVGPVTGVMSYRFDRRRILPRTSADLP